MTDTEALAQPEAGPREPPDHATHFESLERQAHATRLGMWIFLVSEALLFSGFFALYGAYRAMAPQAFVEGVRSSDLLLGSANTVILIASSYLVARSVVALRDGERRKSSWLLVFAVLLGASFLSLKAIEYGHHIGEGAVPGGQTEFFLGPDRPPGLVAFYNIYYIATGTHALHVLIGMILLTLFSVLVAKERVRSTHAYRLEAVALYWHLVDCVWIVLWPMFYLMRG